MVFGIRFTEFKERLFQPLEGLVFARENQRTHDYVYVTRHPHIAEIVVSRALAEASDKLDMYLRMISNMNVDYAADHKAFRGLIRGRSLLDEFPDHQMSERVYLAAANQSPWRCPFGFIKWRYMRCIVPMRVSDRRLTISRRREPLPQMTELSRTPSPNYI